MNTLDKLIEDLATATVKVGIAHASYVIIDAFNNKDDFTYTWLDEKTELFKRCDKILNFGRLGITLTDVKHYEEMYKISFDKSPDNTKALKKALKIYEKFDEDNNINPLSIFSSIYFLKIKDLNRFVARPLILRNISLTCTGNKV